MTRTLHRTVISIELFALVSAVFFRLVGQFCLLEKGMILSVKLKTYINCILLTGFSTPKIISFSKPQPWF